MICDASIFKSREQWSEDTSIDKNNENFSILKSAVLIDYSLVIYSLLVAKVLSLSFKL